MPVFLLDGGIHARLFPAETARRLFSDEAFVAAMLRFEAGLARAQAATGIIPAEAGAALARALEAVEIDPESLVAGTASAGMAVPALVKALRDAVPEDLAGFVHYGATSQDVIDTALTLRLAPMLETLAAGLARIAGRLAALADEHRRTAIVARTRWQQAAPTSFGLKVATWLDPLVRLRLRFVTMAPRVLAVQLGGASGNLARFGPAGVLCMERLADQLGLSAAVPWHVSRDRIEELAGWLGALTAALGKIGTDLLLLTQNEVAEIRLSGGGGSSTLPQKQNPVGAEILVALARFTATESGAIAHAALAAHERDGAAWTAEWISLPPLCAAAEAALSVADALLGGMQADEARMRANLEAGGRLVYAEAAAFALARFMPLSAAQDIVKRAVAGRDEPGFDLRAALEPLTDVAVDWDAVFDRAESFGSADALIDRILDEARGVGLVEG